MKCSKLNHHLFLLHAIESPLCIRGAGNEDSTHYLLKCPFHLIARRQMLQDILPITDNVNVDILLHGSDAFDIDQNRLIFKAVHKFIETTKRLD
jgi:hypothetical protein